MAIDPVSAPEEAAQLPEPAAAEMPQASLPASSQDAWYLEPMPDDAIHTYEPSAAEEPEAYVPASGEDAGYLEPMSEGAVQSPESEVAEELETSLPATNERVKSPESASVSNVIELGRTEGREMTNSSKDTDLVQPETRYYASHLPPVYYNN